MSCLKLYWPQTFSVYCPVDHEEKSSGSADEPVILPFRNRRSNNNRGIAQLLERTRLIRENQLCPECNRVAVVPIEAEAALMNRNHMPVPGCGEILGFLCNCCGHEWHPEVG